MALLRISRLRVSADPQMLNEQKLKTLDRSVFRVCRERKGIVRSTTWARKIWQKLAGKKRVEKMGGGGEREDKHKVGTG